ncbi:MAG: translation initiation factor IF-2, partial [Dehalococcoidia bacterium]
GGDTIVVPVSAKSQEGISDLLENIILLAEVSELTANPDCKAQGVVIEARLDTARGAVATVLVQNGTLRIGDAFVVGDTWGKVRAMFDYRGRPVQQAEPSTPVEVLGIDQVPKAGDTLVVEEDGKRTRTSATRDRRRRAAETRQPAGVGNIEQLLAQVRSGEAKELNLILKTDVEGSGEAIRNALTRLESDQVKVKIIRSGSGNVSESDVLLASASNATIVAFSTRAEEGARRLADREGVPIRYYDVIYALIKEMEVAVSGLMEPVYREVSEGRAEVKEVFSIKGGKAAGVGVTEGKINANAMVRVVRNGAVIHESSIKSLRHFKDAVKELASGTEGGIGIEGFDDFEAEDIIEAFRRERVEPRSK